MELIFLLIYLLERKGPGRNRICILHVAFNNLSDTVPPSEFETAVAPQDLRLCNPKSLES